MLMSKRSSDEMSSSFLTPTLTVVSESGYPDETRLDGADDSSAGGRHVDQQRDETIVTGEAERTAAAEQSPRLTDTSGWRVSGLSYT